MRHLHCLHQLLLGGLLLLTSNCGPADEPGFEIEYEAFRPGLREWITAFGEVGNTLTYRNDLGETATLRVSFRSRPALLNYPDLVDCNRNGQPAQCETEVVTLEFHAEGDDYLYVSLRLVGEDQLLLVPNYDDKAFPSFAELSENTQTIENTRPEQFTIAYEPAYDVAGGTAPAIIAENSDPQGLLAIPPTKFILIKGIGVPEWTDRLGRVWKLE